MPHLRRRRAESSSLQVLEIRKRANHFFKTDRAECTALPVSHMGGAALLQGRLQMLFGVLPAQAPQQRGGGAWGTAERRPGRGHSGNHWADAGAAAWTVIT